MTAILSTVMPILPWSSPFEPALLSLKAHLSSYGARIDDVLCHIHGHREAGMCRELFTAASKRPTDFEHLHVMCDVIVDTLLSGVGQSLRMYDDSRTPADLDAALRWHAARLTDLSASLKG
jgi:hypothetical protein